MHAHLHTTRIFECPLCVSMLGRVRTLKSIWAVAKKETARSRNSAFRAFRAPFRVFRDPKITKRGIRRGAE